MKRRLILTLISSVLVVILGIVLIILTFSKNDKTVDINSTLEEVRPTLVKITVGEYHGSGVVMFADKEKIRIITTAHLMQDETEGMITFADGKTGFGRVSKISTEKDLCFIEMDVSDFADDYASKITCAKFDTKVYDSLQEGDSVYLMGSGVLLSRNVFVGTVANTYFYVPEFDMHMLYLYADAMAGMSGCGCFNENGYLLGILIGAADSSEAVCVPLSDILAFSEG